MATLSNNQQPRQVRRSGYDSQTNDTYYGAEGLSDQPISKRPRRLWKKLLIIFLLLIVAGAIFVAALYFWIMSTPLKAEGAGRINIMLLGVDDAASLSDTIMIASIDTASERPRVALISIPRDLYVQIPEFEDGKINSAYTLGQNFDYPGGGPGLSRETLEKTFDLPIHYYAALNFSGFRQLINTVGGVDVDVKTAIDDPFYPTEDYSDTIHFQLPAGPHHLDGETALRYARSRQTTTDFDRAARQQQILAAYKRRVVSKDIWLNSAKRKQLQQTLKQHLHTDLSFRQMLKLGWRLRKLEDSQIAHHVIDSTNFLEPDGGGAYVPRTGDFDEVNKFIADIFKQTGNNLPEAQQ